jgi:hypothetical protein
MTLTPKGQIHREGRVSFGDASISVWEEGIADARKAGGYKGERAWELAFKRQVFARIVQQLNRLGWTCVVPEDYVERYGVEFARGYRACSKGDLRGFLGISGRSIKFEMWQGVNTPTRPDHGGRYESNKEGCAPYLLRLEMERTRRRIRDYLCNVFDGYTFDAKRCSFYRRPMQQTAMERITEAYANSWHFKGDMADYLKRNGYSDLPAYNCTSLDGQRIQHGQRVWFKDWHGRVCEGVAYYNGNSMWWVVTGRYDLSNVSTAEIWCECPPKPRVKRNERTRRKRLEGLLADAVKAMDFDRAKVLKGILWPTPEPLFHIKKGDAYFAPNYSGYRSNPVDAGKYTQAELRPYASEIKSGALQAVPISA